MLRPLVLIFFSCGLLGCGSATEVAPPADAPVIPPATRTNENPGLPLQPGQAPLPNK